MVIIINSFIYFIPLFVVILIMLSENRTRDLAMKKIICDRKTGRKNEMLDMAKKFIDKECLVYTFNSQQITGVIKEVSDGALLIDNGKEIEAVNLDFVVRIREYPRKKNGSKKSVVID